MLYQKYKKYKNRYQTLIAGAGISYGHMVQRRSKEHRLDMESKNIDCGNDTLPYNICYSTTININLEELYNIFIYDQLHDFQSGKGKRAEELYKHDFLGLDEVSTKSKLELTRDTIFMLADHFPFKSFNFIDFEKHYNETIDKPITQYDIKRTGLRPSESNTQQQHIAEQGIISIVFKNGIPYLNNGDIEYYKVGDI